MHIKQDGVIDQRWLVTPSASDFVLIEPKSMLQAMKAVVPGDDDSWFQAYAVKRLAKCPDAKPLLAWLRKQNARHVWQPALSTVLPTFAGPQGWDSFRMAAGIADYQVGLVLLDRDVAMLFKLAVGGLVSDPADDMSILRFLRL